MPYYDDRDSDTIRSLSVPIIKTCDSKAPAFAFFLVHSENQRPVEEGKNPEVDLVVESYVKLSALPKDLAQSIRQALQGK